MSEKTRSSQTETEIIPATFPATLIPDKSQVTSQISISSQTIKVYYSELSGYFDWIKDQATTHKGDALLNQGAKLTANNLHPGEQRWDEIVASGQDADYTLERSIRERTNTCFQRGVFFNVLMQQVGIPVQTLEGIWVESSRAKLQVKPEKPIAMKPDGQGGLLYIEEADKSDGHLWNIAEVGNKYYLVDTSYFIEKEGRPQPVLTEIDYKPGDKYFTLPLPTGKVRHYIADGTVKVEPQSNA